MFGTFPKPFGSKYVLWGAVFLLLLRDFFFEWNSLNELALSRRPASSGPPLRSARKYAKKKGFKPVFVYSKTKNKRWHKDSGFAQAQQDRLILALAAANDAKLVKSERSAAPFFVDLAANHYQEWSNTYVLEKNGWDGLCVEPNPEYWYGLAAHRSCTVVAAFVGGTPDADGSEIDVRLNGIFGGIVGKGMDNRKHRSQGKYTSGDEAKRNLVSILTVFEEHEVPKAIDYFSLDVEGAESLVMEDFPWEEYTIKFLTIERPKEDLRRSLTENGYVKGGTLSHWGEEFWYHSTSVRLTPEEINAIVAKEVEYQAPSTSASSEDNIASN